MRFVQRYKKEAVPEWWDCYMHYGTLKVMLKLVKSTSYDRIQYEKNIFQGQIGNKPYIPSNFQPNSLVVPAEAQTTYLKNVQASQNANKLFLDTLAKQQQLFGYFALHKLRQIEMRFTKAISYYSVIGQDEKLKKKTLYPYLQDLYMESSNLIRMYETNFQAEKRILRRYQLQSHGYYMTPEPQVPTKIDISRLILLNRQIEDFYVKISQKRQQKSRRRIKTITQGSIAKNKDSLIIGLMIGVFIAACVFLAALLIYLRNYVQKDPIFNNDFPVWRGVTLWIIYMWVLGINLHHYEKFNVNHRVILENRSTRYPKSTTVFKSAGLLSTILVIVFTLYTLDVANVISIGSFNPQFLPLFVWVPLVLVLFNPIALFYYRNRDYVFNMLWLCTISWCIPVTYPIVYTTDQLLSVLTSIQDTAYTICYYISFNNSNGNQQVLQYNNCKDPALIAIFAFSMVIFVYRIMQCIKCGLQVQPYDIRCFFNALKYTVAMVSSILSFLLAYDKNSTFVAWIIFGVITSFYTYFWDIKFDWILLEKGSYRFLLRDKLVYDKRMYYILLVVNLFLRCSWVLTISSNIVNNFLGSTQVFILLFSFLELIRRGVWNMLSVQAEHVKNCYNMNALPNTFYTNDKNIEAQLIVNKQKLSNVSVQRLVQNELAATKWTPLAEQVNAEEHKILLTKIKEKREKVKEMKIVLKQNNGDNAELLDQLLQEERRD